MVFIEAISEDIQEITIEIKGPSRQMSGMLERECDTIRILLEIYEPKRLKHFTARGKDTIMRSLQGIIRASFQRKLIFYLSTTIVIVIIVAGYFSYQLQTQLFERELSKQYAKLNEQAMERLSLQIKEVYRISNSIVFNPRIEEVVGKFYLGTNDADGYNKFLGTNELEGLLKGIRYDAPYIKEFYILDKNGNPYYSWNEQLSYLPDQHIFLNVQENLMNSSGELVWFRNPNNPNQVFAARWMKSLHLEPYGMMIMGFDESFLARHLAELLREEQGVVYLFDDRNTLLYAMGKTRESAPSRTQLLVPGVHQIDGIKHLVSANYFPEIRFLLYSDISLAEIQKKSQLGFRNISLFSAIAIIVIAIAAVSLAGRRLLRPLNTLIIGMRRVREGDLDTQIEIKTGDELAFIGASFNAMTSNVKQLVKEVYETQLSHKVAELKALQSQMNPHFLHNTLNAIYWKLYIQGDKDSAQLVASLSSMMKYVLQPIEKTTTLDDELKQIEHYLYIQSSRAGEGFQTVIDVTNEARQCEIIRLILQPLVENVFIHAFEKEAEGNLLMVKGWIDNEQLCRIEVSDNGCGMEKQLVDTILAGQLSQMDAREQSNHIGLQNVIRRMQLVYGDLRGTIAIESTLGEGTTVRLAIPTKTGA